MKHYVIFAPFFVSTDTEMENGFTGGSPTQAYLWAKRKLSEGYRVTVVCLASPGCQPIEKFEGVNIYRVGLVADGQRRLDKLEVETAIKKLNPDELMIFYVHTGLSFLALDSIPPNLYSATTIRFGSAGDILKAPPETIPVIQSCKNILVNFSMLSSFQDRFPEAMVKVVPNQSDSNLFRRFDGAEKYNLREKYGIPQSSTVFLYTGRMVAYKGVETLVHALVAIPTEIDCIGVFVGDDIGDLRKGNKGMVSKLRQLESDFPKRFKYLPTIPYRQMPEIYNFADYFCLASQGEGMSNSLVEALACGLPCIASDIPENKLEGVEIATDFYLSMLEKLAG